jgi:amylosucrase
MEQLRQMRADPCFAPDAWVTTWDSHNPGVLALVRKRGEETLVGLFNFTEYPAGASLDALGGEYHTPKGTSVWLADVELEPYQALLVKNK